MRALYEISGDYAKLLDRLYDDDLPEEVILDTLEGIEGEMSDKAENIAALICDVEASAKAIKEAEERQAARRKAMENKANRLRKYLLDAMTITGNAKFETPRFKISIRNNPESVVVDDEASIPKDYFKEIPASFQLDKNLCKQAIKDGFSIPGCHLSRSTSLSIK